MSSSGKSKASAPTLKKATVVVVRTEWNADIVDELFAGVKKIFDREKIELLDFHVPGAFEIPFAIKKIWTESGKHTPDAFIALACIIRGDTPHFDYVCRAITDGISHLNLELPVPTIFGVLTVENTDQAKQRIGGIHGHKGEEAAIASMKMISFSRSL